MNTAHNFNGDSKWLIVNLRQNNVIEVSMSKRYTTKKRICCIIGIYVRHIFVECCLATKSLNLNNTKWNGWR